LIFLSKIIIENLSHYLGRAGGVLRIPRARRDRTISGAHDRVIPILTGAKILCTAYATANVDAVSTDD